MGKRISRTSATWAVTFRVAGIMNNLFFPDELTENSIQNNNRKAAVDL